MKARKTPAATRERKSVAFEVKDLGEAGEFTGLASVYGVKDLQGDVVDKGAFTKSLETRGREVPILWQHDPTQPIGLGDLVDTPQGLQIKGRLDLDNPQGKTAYSGLKKGYLKGLSIGYDVAKQKFADGARHLQEVDLYEVSTVTFPANTDALVSAVKGLDALPAYQRAIVAELQQKDASYQDKMCALYDALREAFPLVSPWVIETYDAYCIVGAGDRYFQVDITAWDEDGEPTLGAVTEVEKSWTPVRESADAIDTASKAVKVGRRLSAATIAKVKAAHQHAASAAEHLQEVLNGTAEPDKGSAPDEVKSALTGLTETLRRLSA